MEPEKRGRGKRPAPSPLPGTFEPARPGDTQDVVTLFAIAARAACAEPTALSAIGATLNHICQSLVAPEALAARECAQMWQLFARVALLPKDTLRQEAGRAFCRDLDALAQRLELPPLAEWKDLPQGVADPAFIKRPGLEAPSSSPAAEVGPATPGASLADIRAQAQALVQAHPDKRGPPSAASASLIAALDAGERATWLDAMVGTGALSRGDVSLLIRHLAKGGAIGAGDSMLIEVLGRLVTALAGVRPPRR